MNGMYICSDRKTMLDKEPGVAVKIDAQIDAFNRAGLNCSAAYYKQGATLIAKVLRRTPISINTEEWPDVSREKKIDYCYIRKPCMTKGFLKYLAELRSVNPKAKILMEIPTYPYDMEMMSFSQYPILIKDRWNRKRLNKYLDRIVALTDEVEVFGVAAIRFTNGINLATLRPRNFKNHVGSESDVINIACSARFAFWHGLDRFVEGLRLYYREGSIARNIHVHLMGDGQELKVIKKAVSKNHLDNHFTFYGMLDFSQMNPIFEKCSFAIDVLGLHRKGLARVASLKSREYLARGIPFIYSGAVDVFENDPVDFCLQVPADDSPIDIEALIEFHDYVYSLGECQIIETIRLYAERHVGMDRAMENVIGYIKGKEEDEKQING